MHEPAIHLSDWVVLVSYIYKPASCSWWATPLLNNNNNYIRKNDGDDFEDDDDDYL